MDGWILIISIWIFGLESESELLLKKKKKARKCYISQYLDNL